MSLTQTIIAAKPNGEWLSWSWPKQRTTTRERDTGSSRKSVFIPRVFYVWTSMVWTGTTPHQVWRIQCPTLPPV